jgi:hypothetical protein
VLLAVARAAGVDIWGTEAADDRCSVTFSGARLEDGLRRLFGDYDYVMAVPDAAESALGIARLRVWLHVPPDRRAVAPTTLEDDTVGDEPGDRDLVRLEAAAFFESAGDAALLEAAAGAESSAVRLRALQALADRESSAALDASVAALEDADPSLHAGAGVQIAGSSDPRALDTLRAMLRDPDPQRRLQAIQWLEVRADPESLPDVRESLNDRHQAIRTAARRLVDALDGLHRATRPR